MVVNRHSPYRAGRGASRPRLLLLVTAVVVLVLVIVGALVAAANLVLSERAAAHREQRHAAAAVHPERVPLDHDRAPQRRVSGGR